MSTKPVLGYWAIRGLGDPIRMMLYFSGVDFEDKHYVRGPAPNFDKSCWFDVKHKFGLPIPNLPYYVDGPYKICQTDAICRYIARKYGLEADDEESRIRVDMLGCELDELRSEFFKIVYAHPGYNVDDYADKLVQRLKGLSDLLGDHPWFAGRKLTYIDFLAFEHLDQQLIFKKDCLDYFPNLQKYMKRFRDQPKIKAYFSSPKYKKLPICDPSSVFYQIDD